MMDLNSKVETFKEKLTSKEPNCKGCKDTGFIFRKKLVEKIEYEFVKKCEYCRFHKK